MASTVGEPAPAASDADHGWDRPALDPPEPIARVLRRVRRRRVWQFALLVLALAVAMGAALAIGPMRIDVLAWLRGAELEGPQRLVLEQIRLPRVLLGALIGAGLALAGAAFQGLFRNPLADPGLIGVSAGGALGAVSVIVLGERFLPAMPPALAPWLLAAAAFAGSFGAAVLIYRLSRHDGQPVVATMLLAGVAINALCGALTGLLTFLATDQQVRDLTFWMLGSLGAATWPKVALVAPPVVVAALLLPFLARALNALLLGESEAAHLGFEVARTKWLLVGLTTLMVGVAVAFAGVIGFVGLVVPHAVRLFAGPDHRFLLPASAVLGAALLVAADLLARTAVAPAELPIGVLTALVGAPFFLWLLLRVKAAWQP